MSKPIIAAKAPAKTELEAGKNYYWCRCGRSQSQPFCDGSHRGTEFTPQAFTPKEDGEAHLCMCKHTGNPPYCDGSHAKLPKEDEQPLQNVNASSGSVQPTPEEPTVKTIHDFTTQWDTENEEPTTRSVAAATA